LPNVDLVTSEDLTSDTFTVVLNSEPIADVTLAVDNSTAIGIAEGSVDIPSYTFNNINWNQTQTFTVTGIDDAVVDGDQRYVINLPLTTTDLKYSVLATPSVNVVNQDNDIAQPLVGVTVTPTNGLVTSETGTTATFTVVLNTIPDGNVDIYFGTYDTTEGLVTPEFATYNATNWDQPQTFTITGQDDALLDGPITYVIPLNSGSSKLDYDLIPVDPVTVTNKDNDTPGITVTPINGLITSENGSTATFTVVLNSPPTSEVDIFPASDNMAEGIASPTFLIFLPSNWEQPQTVTVTGLNDMVADPDAVYNILLDPQSSDINYDKSNANFLLTIPSVEVTNLNIQ
jgi:hypothetical protein